MRICVISYYWPTTLSSSEGQTAYNTVRELAKTPGMEVEVIVVNSRAPFEKKPYEAHKKCSIEMPTVRVTCLTYASLPKLSRGMNGRLYMAAIERKVREGKFDILMSYFLYPDGYAVARLGKKLGIPTVLTAIGSDVNCVQGAAVRKSRAALRAASHVLTVSSELREKIISSRAEIPPERVSTVMNGCDLEIFRYTEQSSARNLMNLASDARHILYVGRLDLKKGLRELISAVHQINDPKMYLHIVGEGAAYKELAALAETPGRKSNIRFWGKQCPECIAKLMCASDIFTLPSYNEGCPNVILEALSCGCPVVATRVGAIPQLVGENGILVESHSISSLAEGLRSALELAASGYYEREAISRQHTRSWAAVGKDILEVIHKVV